MKINTVAILGAGAVGSYFLYGLEEKLQSNLCVIASGERKEKLCKEGLYINGQKKSLMVKTPEEAKNVDLLIVSLKYNSLQKSVSEIEKIVGKHTIVVSPMNGIDSEEIIGETIGMEHMVYSMIKIASERNGLNIHFDPKVTPGIYFGPAKECGREEQIEAMIELFADSKVKYILCENILQDIWYKYALNISKNLPQAMVGCAYGAYNNSIHMAKISELLLDEVIAVAAAKGIDISDKNHKTLQTSMTADNARYSTLQDLDAKRETEIEMFSGTLMRLGKKLGVPTPYNELTYHIIKALEEKNAGKFEF